MLTNDKPHLESRNFIDGVDFTKNDPCIFVVYPAGASGDLLMSIIDKHYIKTGCEYYGISNTGRVHFYSTDYEIIDLEEEPATLFNQQWFHNLANKLSGRNLNYSLLDQVMFGCHQFLPYQITNIIDIFPQAKVINIYPDTELERSMIDFQRRKKLHNCQTLIDTTATNSLNQELVVNTRVLNISYGNLFNKQKFEEVYDQIVNFLDLNGKLIRYDYIEYYISKQDDEFKNSLKYLHI
jgi:hypothetical protein